MSPEPYSTYRPSGVPWLADVPVHWEMRRGRWLFRKMDRPVRDTDEVITCFRDGTVTLRKNRRKEGFTESLKEIGYQGIRNGDLVVHQMDAFAGAVGVSDSDGKGTPVYSVCHPSQDADPFYYAHIVREMARSLWILALAKGIRERSTDFRYSEFALQALPLPPLPEQTTIVRYLDHADRRIRRYISAKRKLIALLEEERQAVVNRTVTRGLDPDVRLKPSGVEWLGDVPEHWEVRRLRSLAAIGTGGRDTIDRKENGPYPFFVRSQTVERIETWSFDGEAVLTAGDGVGVGKVFHYANGKFDYHQRVYKFSEFRHLLGQFFFHYFRSTLRNEVFQGTAKSTVDSLRLPMLQNFPVALPPPSEQRAISEYLDKATAAIDSTIVRARRQIELLQEYRTRLIADVVTGKLDVREAAAQLPDEADDQDSIEETGPLTDGIDKNLYDTEESVEEPATESEVSI